jgi:FtsP/CotA-like multicopper oxidase with cupredoxin domain
MRKSINFFLILCCIVPNLYAQTQTVDLTVAYKEVNFAHKKMMAIAVNGQIPGPTLHFQEGDDVIIRVHNQLKVGTSVHWHGLLVPWRMDGVEHVTQEPIAPQGEFTYHFKIKQSGTYWYHAHADLQEQQGLYGAIIIDSKIPPAYHYDKDFPIVLSDWSNENPDNIYKHLKQEGDFYSQALPLQPTLQQFFKDLSGKTKAEKEQIWKAYWDMEIMRMSTYDLSDVAYDAFLLNGKTQYEPWQQFVKVGDTIRLRLIGAGASTVFKIKIDNEPLAVVEVQGNDIKPLEVKEITLAPGQTIDVLLKIKEKKPYSIYAESLDTSGYAVGILNPTDTPITHIPAVTPFPQPPPMSMSGMDHTMPEMDMPAMSHDMSAMDNKVAMPENDDEAQQWQALKPTNDPNKSVTVLTMRLGGYMDRYMWFINGLPEYLAKPILIEPGKRYRFVFLNETMMHHPMHLHGHWMILRNGHGAYDPLVHTIDVGPFQTMTADFDADAGSGWWYFHCHNLYHMKAGMARVLHYDTSDDVGSDTSIKGSAVPTVTGADAMTDTEMKQNELPATTGSDVMTKTAHPAGTVLTNDWQYGHDFARNVDQITATTLYGGDYNKLQLYTNQAQITRGTVTDADVDMFAWHVLNDFWAIKGGINYSYRPAAYWQPGAGLEGTLPFFIATNIRSYWHDGSGEIDVDLSRNIPLIGNWSLYTEIEAIAATQSLDYAQIGQGFNNIQYTIGPSYQLFSSLALQLQYQYTRNYGDTASILKANSQGPTSSLLTLGLEAVF